MTTIDLDAGPHACPECLELVDEGFTLHPGCCPHDDYEPVDDRDGGAGTVWEQCLDCGGDATDDARDRAADRAENDAYTAWKERL
jgi:hypothetical protein